MEVIKIKISILPPIGLSLSVTPPIGIQPTIPTADQGKLVIEGKPGKTPFIGENGNWWIEEIDTGVKAKGLDGEGLGDHETTYQHNNLPTADEKAALAGTGIPSSSNKYVTENTLTTALGNIETALTEILS